MSACGFPYHPHLSPDKTYDSDTGKARTREASNLLFLFTLVISATASYRSTLDLVIRVTLIAHHFHRFPFVSLTQPVSLTKTSSTERHAPLTRVTVIAHTSHRITCCLHLSYRLLPSFWPFLSKFR